MKLLLQCSQRAHDIFGGMRVQMRYKCLSVLSHNFSNLSGNLKKKWKGKTIQEYKMLLDLQQSSWLPA